MLYACDFICINIIHNPYNPVKDKLIKRCHFIFNATICFVEIQEYRNIYENEGKHFFYRANRALFLSFISGLRKKSGRPLKILDAGCGTGLLAKKLRAFGEVTGVDIDPRAIFYSKKRGIKVRKASINNLPFKSKTFDVVVSMDVLYHKRVNDKKALSEIYRVLKPHGYVLLRVPANPILFSSHDRFVHTRERYIKSKLFKKLTNAGFGVEKISYVNSILFFPALAKVVFEKITGARHSSSGINRIPNILNQTIIVLSSVESLILKHFSLPIGIGLFAVAKKQKNT